MIAAMKVYRIANAIRSNVDEWYLDLVTYDRFQRRNDRLWRRAKLAGIVDEVSEALWP